MKIIIFQYTRAHVIAILPNHPYRISHFPFMGPIIKTKRCRRRTDTPRTMRISKAFLRARSSLSRLDLKEAQIRSLSGFKNSVTPCMPVVICVMFVDYLRPFQRGHI
jgi:hypothetical protein